MIGAGTIINPILKIVTTVAILGAVYLFIVKPALDTTENLANNAFDTSDGIEQQIRENLDNAFGEGARDVQIPASAKKAERLGDCVNAAGTDTAKVQRCLKKFSP